VLEVGGGGDERGEGALAGWPGYMRGGKAVRRAEKARREWLWKLR